MDEEKARQEFVKTRENLDIPKYTYDIGIDRLNLDKNVENDFGYAGIDSLGKLIEVKELMDSHIGGNYQHNKIKNIKTEGMKFFAGIPKLGGHTTTEEKSTRLQTYNPGVLDNIVKNYAIDKQMPYENTSSRTKYLSQ